MKHCARGHFFNSGRNTCPFFGADELETPRPISCGPLRLSPDNCSEWALSVFDLPVALGSKKPQEPGIGGHSKWAGLGITVRWIFFWRELKLVTIVAEKEVNIRLKRWPERHFFNQSIKTCPFCGVEGKLEMVRTRRKPVG